MKRPSESRDRASPSGHAPSLVAVAVLREPVFSPGMVEKDAAILRASAEKLSELRGVACPVLTVEELAGGREAPALVISMAEGEEALALVESLEARGTIVLNSTASIRATRRAALLDLARPLGPLVEGALVPTDDADSIPPSILALGSVWVKRADYHALGPGDVVRSASGDVRGTLQTMHARGIARAVVQPHLAGEVVKFYGVLAPDGSEDSSFFRWFALEGGAGPDAAAAERLRAASLLAARRSGLTVFGGDAVLSAPGSDAAPVLIDLNAWPSFWRCRDEAALAIARLALGRLEALALRAPARPGLGLGERRSASGRRGGVA